MPREWNKELMKCPDCGGEIGGTSVQLTAEDPYREIWCKDCDEFEAVELFSIYKTEEKN